MEKKIVMVFAHNSEKISFKNDNLIVCDKEGKIKTQISCYKLFAVFVVGGITLSSGIIQRSKKFAFSIVLFSPGFKIYSTINFALEGNTFLRKKQYTTEDKIETAIAKQLIINKLYNQQSFLKKMRDKSVEDGIENIGEIIEKLKTQNYSSNEIMGFEGIGAKVYFNRLYKNLDWKGRKLRVKNDEINLLLNIAYTVLFNYIEAILNIYGFDIYKGNLHKEFYKRKSLVCDIIEPFRVIVDYKIRKMMNLGQIKHYHFYQRNNQFGLEWKDSNEFVLAILDEITGYKKSIFRYIQQYYRWFMKNKTMESFPFAELKENDYC